MKKIIAATIFVLLATPFIASASPISWDFAGGVLQPLQSAWSAVIKGDHYIATSTVTASTFPYASTTAISSSNLVSGNCVQASTGGLLTTVSLPCGSGSSSFGQDFNFVAGTPNYLIGTTSPLGLIMTASSTIGGGTQATGLTIAGGATTSKDLLVQGNATSTNFASTLASTTKLYIGTGSCTGSNALQTDTSGKVSCGAVSGGGVGNWFTPVPLFGATTANATSTLTGFTAGLYSLSTSTIGGGTQTTGLTVAGGSTTTLSALFQSGFTSSASSTVNGGLAINSAGRLTDNTGNLNLTVGLGTAKCGVYVTDNFNAACATTGAAVGGVINNDTNYVNYNVASFQRNSNNNGANATNGAGATLYIGAGNTTNGSDNIGNFTRVNTVGVQNTGTSYGYVTLNYLQTTGSNGTLSNFVGYESKGQFATAGPTLSNQYDFRADNFSVATNGTTTNRYGLYLNFDNTAVTNAYGVYQVSPTLKNVLAGSLGVGTTSPYAKFAVAGSDTSTTLFGADAPSGFSGNLLDLKLASTTKFSINQAGGLLSVASSTIGAGTQIGGLTIAGGATTSKDLLVQGNATSTNFVATLASSTTQYFGTGSCTGSNALQTDTSGKVSCGAVTGSGAGDPFTHTSVWGQTTSATSTLLALTGSPFSLVASSSVAIGTAGSEFLISSTGNSTSTNATTTTSFATTASSTKLFADVATLGNLTLGHVLTVANGGTGAATLTGCLTGNGTGAITGSGTCNTSSASVTSIATTWPISGGTITTSGTLTWAGLASSSNIAAPQALYATGVNTFASVATGTVAAGTGISIGGVTNGYVLNTGFTITNSGVISGSCTWPQTCSGTNPLAITWSGLASSSNIVNTQALYATGVNTYASSANHTLTAILDTITNASTTALTVGSFFTAPNQSSSPANTVAGSIVIDTNGNASSSVAIGDGSTTHNIFSLQSKGGIFASSTLAYYGAYGTTGTTTLALPPDIHKQTIRSIQCFTPDGGTAWVGFGSGSATTTELQCSAVPSSLSISSNNTINGGAKGYIEIGHSSSAAVNVTVSADIEESN